MPSKCLSIGIVGLPNVGKSTLFGAITKKQVNIANYPFCTIDPNVGVVAVPDERVDKLAALAKSAKKIYATVEFVDIAGLVAGANKGEGLGNQFLANIRETDAIVYVLRIFPSDTIINMQKTLDARRDKEILDTELALKDLETVGKRLTAAQKDAKSGAKDAIKEVEVLKKTHDLLQRGQILSEQVWPDDEMKILKNYQLLTLKPRLYLLNGYDDAQSAETVDIFKKNNWPYIVIDVLGEYEAGDLPPAERESLGLPAQSQLDLLIKKCYELLGLITFLTTGEDETRAWTIKRGAPAPQAAGVIHTDFENNFICAEVINWRDLLESGGQARAKQMGRVRTEGKEYIVADGDVMEIRHGAA